MYLNLVAPCWYLHNNLHFTVEFIIMQNGHSQVYKLGKYKGKAYATKAVFDSFHPYITKFVYWHYFK